MATLRERLDADLKDAMRSKDELTTSVIRMLKSAIKYKEVEPGATGPLEEQAIIAVIGTLIKQRRDSIEQFTKGNRPELAAIEAAEIVVIEEFLPRALDEAGLQALVAEAVAEAAAASGQKPTPKEMGQVIKAVQAKLQAAGMRAEGRVVSELVKKALAA